MDTDKFLVSGISVPFDAEDGEITDRAKTQMKRAGIDTGPLHFQIYKKSVDARKRNDIRAVCSVLVTADHPVKADEKRLAGNSIRLCRENRPKIVFGNGKLRERPLVVGMGPCGMFAALLLAENGYRPILIDRGGSVGERVGAVERFFGERILDGDCNIQFGAGGAGTFSDGKLVTRIGDDACGFVLETFHRFGAPDDVLTRAKPHIGTDILRGVVSGILTRIGELGGTLMYRTRLEDIRREPDGSLVAITNRGTISCGTLVLAIGHSARDTYAMLGERGFALLPKPFSVGVRVEHLRADIDRALFGDFAGHPKLGKGEYNLSYTAGERGVYTFCMCPGGEVVAAASEEGGVVVNGMSRHARDGINSNSAVAVSVVPEDFGNDVGRAIAFQRELERRAFAAGGGDYSAPIMTMGDFLSGRFGSEPGRVMPTYMGGACRVADFGTILPDFVTRNLSVGFAKFAGQISCFTDAEAILTAVETRTSAPLRIARTEEMTALGNDLVYPCGEGAGYAGGITSAAVDGIHVAEKIMARFSPRDIG